MYATAVRDRSWAATLALFAFPLVLWGVATLFFGGDLGRMADDYWMLRRDPVSGALRLPATYTEERPFFIRAVYFLVCHNLITIGYGHEWIVHALMAVVHGLVALLLFAVLRRANVGTLAATGAALLFLVVPLCHQSVFWMAAMGNDASLAAYLLLALVMLRRSYRGAASPWLPFVLAFSVPCWNEQGAAAIPALAFLCLAARPADQPLERVVRRTALFTSVCTGAVALYLALLLGTAPSGVRGSPLSITSAVELWPRARQIAYSAWRWTGSWWGRDLAVGGLIRASEELRTARGGIALGLLGITGAAFAARWAAASRPPEASATTRGACRLRWLTLYGVSVVLLAFVPIVVIRTQPLESRLWTVPAAGFAIVAASGFEALLRAAAGRGRRWVAGALGTAIATCGVALAGSMVGLQGLYRDNTSLDRGVPEQLAALVPDPEPGTVFVPLEARVRSGRTGRPNFDRALTLAWYQHYAISPLTREVFARDDIDITPMNPWVGLELSHVTPETFVVPCRIEVDGAVQTREGKARVPWSQTVPFVIDGRGRVTLVRRVWVERANGRDVEISETRVPRDVPASPSFVLPARDSGRSRPLVGWRRGGWATTSDVVAIQSGRACGLERPVLGLGPGGIPARLAARLEASSAPSLLVFRIALAGEPPSAGAAHVRCSWESEPERPLAQLDLSFADLSEQGRWAPFVVDLRSLAAERPICLEVSCDPADRSGSVLVTPGVRLFPGPEAPGR